MPVADAFRRIVVALAMTFAVSPALAQTEAICPTASACRLDQGWSDGERAWWYTVSQGSRLLPLSWFRALEAPDGSGRFAAPARMADYGYLANPGLAANPEGLPLGFAVDHDPTPSADLMCETFPETCVARTMRQPWVGMTCSACHTNEIAFGGKRLRIEGAPTLADFDRFSEDLLRALKRTAEDGDVFDRFAGAVLGLDRDETARRSLQTQLREQIVWQELLEARNKGAVVAGPARLDAQGHILNKVALVVVPPAEMASQLSELKADAPASYPFIWNTAQQDKVQWNGIANKIAGPSVFGQKTEIGALVRNTSEVVGVFAHVEAYHGRAATGYRSSVRVGTMIRIERQLERLRSPRWPDGFLPPIDRARADRGEALFATRCAGCHEPLRPDDLTTKIEVEMTPIGSLATDIFLACNTFEHRSKAGGTKGERVFGFAGEAIEAEDFTHKMLVNVAVGAALGQFDEIVKSLWDDLWGRRGAPAPVTAAAPTIDYLPGVPAGSPKKAQAEQCLSTSHDLLRYKARPLNGIWASAPYLHNGSVPTLYDLLLPSTMRLTAPIAADGSTVPAPAASGDVRPMRFGVGGRAFDPKRVGFATDPAGNPAMFEAETAAGEPIPGNYNSGHSGPEYGDNQLSDEDRWDLVEYMKTL